MKKPQTRKLALVKQVITELTAQQAHQIKGGEGCPTGKTKPNNER